MMCEILKVNNKDIRMTSATLSSAICISTSGSFFLIYNSRVASYNIRVAYLNQKLLFYFKHCNINFMSWHASFTSCYLILWAAILFHEFLFTLIFYYCRNFYFVLRSATLCYELVFHFFKDLKLSQPHHQGDFYQAKQMYQMTNLYKQHVYVLTTFNFLTFSA